MAKREKREQRIRANPSNVPLEDFESLIRQYGYIVEGSKHPKAVIGKAVFSYKRLNPVDKEYVEYILSLINALKKTGDENG